jgi:hypothetical protein
LLDESIQHRRDTELSHPSVRLGDFHPPYRLRLVGSSSLLRAIRLEVVGREQENDCHRLAEIFEIADRVSSLGPTLILRMPAHKPDLFRSPS